MTHQARKRFGQNFLQDTTIIDELVAHLNTTPEEHWVEIGPGLGALTAPLLACGVKLEVVELDRDLVAHLTRRFAQQPRLTIHSADALKFDFKALAANGEKLRVVGNLPYNISTPLLFHLLENAEAIADMHFMLQKEVVDRICAEPGSKSYGRLSVMMQYFCEAEWLFDVPPESFDPVPKVMSAIVRLTPHTTPPVEIGDRQRFSEIVQHAFSQRRKTVRNSLGKLLDENQLIAAGIDPKARAEELSLADYAFLSQSLSGD
jgi:16S rRNA (adenine1518-N6/adenine1519-N6)-dimethyltransferase